MTGVFKRAAGRADRLKKIGEKHIALTIEDAGALATHCVALDKTGPTRHVSIEEILSSMGRQEAQFMGLTIVLCRRA